MLESGLSGSVRGVPSNGHPYRDPGPDAEIPSFNHFVGAAARTKRRNCNASLRRSLQRSRWRLPEQCAMGDRKAAELPKTMISDNASDG